MAFWKARIGSAGHRAFKGIDKEEAAVGHVDIISLYLATEVGVSRSVNDVDLVAVGG